MSASDSDAVVDPVDLELRDGRHVTVRTIREEDADKLQEAIRGLSTESSRARFFSPLRQLPPQLLERATHPEPERELQLIAVFGDGAQEKIVGGARYAALPQDGDCEFAVAIVDEWHGLGLARRLPEMLMERARIGGFRRMEGYVLASNTRMLSLANRLGFTAMASSEGQRSAWFAAISPLPDPRPLADLPCTLLFAFAVTPILEPVSFRRLSHVQPHA